RRRARGRVAPENTAGHRRRPRKHGRPLNGRGAGPECILTPQRKSPRPRRGPGTAHPESAPALTHRPPPPPVTHPRPPAAAPGRGPHGCGYMSYTNLARGCPQAGDNRGLPRQPAEAPCTRTPGQRLRSVLSRATPTNNLSIINPAEPNSTHAATSSTCAWIDISAHVVCVPSVAMNSPTDISPVTTDNTMSTIRV